MAVTFADIRTSVQAKLVRTDTVTQGYIDDQIKAAVRYCSRKPWHFTEIRQGFLSTSASCDWYTSAQFVESNTPCLFVTLDLATAAMVASEVSAKDILRIDQINAPTQQDQPLEQISYAKFMDLQRGTNNVGSSAPTAYTRYGQQIGLYPTPNTVLDLEISAVVKPIVPTTDAGESVFFDQARDLIEAFVCEKVCTLYLSDGERAGFYRESRQDEESALQLEHANQTATGKTEVNN